MVLKIECSCGHSWIYKPRDPKKIPKRPHSKCSKCNKWINIKRSKLINSNNYKKIGHLKIVRKKIGHLKIVQNLKILELLDKGLYAQEIAQKHTLSASFLSRIINSFESRNLIEQIQAYPKRYKCTNLGTLILEQGDLKQSRIQEFTTGQELLPKEIESVRVHKLRFKNKLVQKPPWLNRIQNEGIIFGLNIKRIELKNWDKFLIFFNYQDFNGLENIEICNKVIIYNFNRNIDEQYVSSNKELKTYFKDVISDCKKARTLLQQKGFIIDERDPEECQKPHYAIKSNGDPEMIGSLGKILNITIETPTETREIDDSPGKGDGEEETDDIEKVKSYFDMPNELENVKANLQDLGGKINTLNEKVVQTITKDDLNEINSKIKETNEVIMEMAKGIKEMTKAMTNLTNQPPQETKEEAEAGGMYQ